MKSLLEYKNLIMSTGLIPAIVCMIFCIFFQDAVVLYVCSLASIIYILYRLVKPPVYQPNLVLLHGTLALIIASIIKGISGDMLIPCLLYTSPSPRDQRDSSISWSPIFIQNYSPTFIIRYLF